MPTDRKTSLLWLWIALGIGAVGAFLLAVTVVGLAAYQLRASRQTYDAAQAEAAGGDTSRANLGPMSRDEFRKAVLGKVPNDVIAAVGRPAMVDDYEGQ